MKKSEGGERQPKPLGTPIHVNVHAQQNPQGWVEFWHEWGFEGGPSRGKGRIELRKGTRETPIHFHLHDRTNLRLTFMADADDAMWVSTGACPEVKMNEGGQITFPCGKTEPKHLRVNDKNEGAECLLKYT